MEILLLIFSFFFSLSLFLIYKKICIKLNIVDLPTLSNVHKRIVPTASGLIFYIVFVLSFLIISLIYGAQINFFLLQKNFIILIISLSLLTIVSFYDDLKDIHPIIRLFIQLTTVFICTSLFDLSNIHVSLKIIIFIIVYFWVYIINIINFTDGVDGFLTINSLNFFFFIFYYFYQSNDYNISFYISLILIPILLAYLILNKPPAQIFMGDCGSIFLGFLIGFISVKLFLIGRFDLIISLLAYPFLDCTLTIVKKVFNKNYPWARLFDYYFLIPIKSNFTHKKVFYPNCIYNLIISIIVYFQIIFQLKALCVLSLIAALFLLYYFNSFRTYKRDDNKI